MEICRLASQKMSIIVCQREDTFRSQNSKTLFRSKEQPKPIFPTNLTVTSIMKIFALLLAIVAIVQGKPAFTTSKALNVRGGGSLGPLDADMVATVGSAALASYIGGSAAKFVAGQAGGSAPAVSNN